MYLQVMAEDAWKEIMNVRQNIPKERKTRQTGICRTFHIFYFENNFTHTVVFGEMIFILINLTFRM